MATIITITSGKGGVGKTSISLNLALALAAGNHKVCLFDADLGLANVNILTGIFPEHGLEEVFSGDLTLTDIMIREFEGVDIIPGSSGVEQMADLTAAEAGRLINAFLELDAYDFFIFDTSAGISAQVQAFCRACHEMVLVVTPEPTSLTDAYSLLKVLSGDKTLPLPRVRVVVNDATSGAAAKTAYAKLKRTVQKFLPLKISALGIVARDPNVPIAVVSQIPFFSLFPDSPASRCIRSVSTKLTRDTHPQKDTPLEIFWDRALGLMASPKAKKGETQAPAPEGNAVPPGLENRLGRIEDKLSLLLAEMAGIKQVLTSGSRPAENREAPAGTPVPEASKQEKITLDFEAWMANRKS